MNSSSSGCSCVQPRALTAVHRSASSVSNHAHRNSVPPRSPRLHRPIQHIADLDRPIAPRAQKIQSRRTRPADTPRASSPCPRSVKEPLDLVQRRVRQLPQTSPARTSASLARPRHQTPHPFRRTASTPNRTSGNTFLPGRSKLRARESLRTPPAARASCHDSPKIIRSSSYTQDQSLNSTLIPDKGYPRYSEQRHDASSSPPPRRAAANCSPRPATSSTSIPRTSPKTRFPTKTPSPMSSASPARKPKPSSLSFQPIAGRVRKVISPQVVLGADTTVTIDTTSSANRTTQPTPRACSPSLRPHPSRHHRRRRRHRRAHRGRRRSHRRPLSHLVRRRNRRLHRHRRAHGQGRRLRYPGPRCPLDSPHRRGLLQRSRPASRPRHHHARISRVNSE